MQVLNQNHKSQKMVSFHYHMTFGHTYELLSQTAVEHVELSMEVEL